MLQKQSFMKASSQTISLSVRLTYVPCQVLLKTFPCMNSAFKVKWTQMAIWFQKSCWSNQVIIPNVESTSSPGTAAQEFVGPSRGAKSSVDAAVVPSCGWWKMSEIGIMSMEVQGPGTTIHLVGLLLRLRSVYTDKDFTYVTGFVSGNFKFRNAGWYIEGMVTTRWKHENQC